MNLYRLLKVYRAAIAALALVCTTEQRVHAVDVFNQEASWGNIAQLATAVLTLPSGIAAQAKPDDKGLALLNHTIKLANELLAAGQQYSPYNAAWACFDTVQSAKILRALVTETQANDIAPISDNNLTIEKAIEAAATTTDSDAPTSDPLITTQQWQNFVHHAGYVLATAEAITRILAACHNENTWPKWGKTPSLLTQLKTACTQQSEWLHGMTSLIRLAHYCLQAPDKRHMAIVLTLFITNAIVWGWQYKSIEDIKTSRANVHRLLAELEERHLADKQAENEQKEAKVAVETNNTTEPADDVTLTLPNDNNNNTLTLLDDNNETIFLPLDMITNINNPRETLALANPATSGNDHAPHATIQTPDTKQATMPKNDNSQPQLSAALLTVQEHRPLRSMQGLRRSYNQDNDFNVCLAQFVEEHQHQSWQSSPMFQWSFNQWCQARGIEPFFDQGMLYYIDQRHAQFMRAFNTFWNNIQHDRDGTKRPSIVRPIEGARAASTGTVDAFCRDFATYYATQSMRPVLALGQTRPAPTQPQTETQEGSTTATTSDATSKS